ncbi:MAG: alginate lyase family protein [Chitinophagaceae bacterium]|nr:alginate lyase family protein [Chitinophagaceae bacterium]
MKNFALSIAGLLFLLLSHASEQQTPRVFALELKSLEKNKGRVNAKDPAIIPAYKALIKEATKALDFGPVSVMEKRNTPPSGSRHDYMSLAPYHWPDPSKPNGLPYMRKDGQTNPEVLEYKDKEYMPKLCEAVYTLGLAYYFSGDKGYAEHAAKLVRVWFLDTATRMNPNLNFAQAIKGINTGRGAGLIDSRHFIKLIDGIGLLQGSKYWTAIDQQSMQHWFSEFLTWMQTSEIGKDEMNAPNNHGAWYDAQRLALALYIGNNELAKSIILNARERLDKQMDNDGRFPKEMERTISLHYTAFVMNAFFNIASMASNLGMEEWKYTSPSGKSLKKGFDRLLPYITGEKEWDGQQIKPFEVEDSYPLLAQGWRLGCKKCKEAIKTLADDKAERLRINLLN